MSRNLLPDVVREKEYQTINWTPFHRHVVSLEMAGFTPSQIADLTEYSLSRISVILNDPRAQIDRDSIGKQVAEKMTDVHLKFKMHANEALEELVDELRGSEDERIRQKSALAILDRAGYSKYQGEHIPRPEIGEEAAARLIAAVADIKGIKGPEYELMPVEIVSSDPRP